MTAITHALTTKEKVKTQLGITGTDSDAQIDSLIGYITDFIEGSCGGRRFKRTTYSNEQYDTEDCKRDLFLKQMPVSSVTSVEYRTGTVTNPSWITYNADNYIPYLPEGYIHFFASLGKTHLGLRVTYVAGYLIDFANETNASLHTLPQDISGLATDLVCLMIQKKGTEGIQSQTTEGQSVTFTDPEKVMNSIHKSIIQKYTILHGV